MILTEKFFHRDALDVAPELVGKIIVRRFEDGTELRERIAEVEVYRGEEDKACHASKGRTKRTEVLYGESGLKRTATRYTDTVRGGSQRTC